MRTRPRISIPVYTVRVSPNRAPMYRRGPVEPARRALRDPSAGGACRISVPIYRVALKKERTLRVPEVRISMPAQAARVAHALIGDSPYEKMLAILIDSGGKLAGAVVIATTSSISSAAVSVRGVFSAAIAHNASAIILAHNHPSGASEPSEDDRRTLQKMRRASEILDIPIVDSLIVTMDPTRWTSFC